jgi:hypothetical protein
VTRLLVLGTPPFATVCALFGLAVVAPGIGFLALLLAVSGAGLALTSSGGGSAVAFERLEAGHEGRTNVDPSNLSFEVPKRSFLVAYVYGVGGLGVVALVISAVLLF